MNRQESPLKQFGKNLQISLPKLFENFTFGDDLLLPLAFIFFKQNCSRRWPPGTNKNFSDGIKVIIGYFYLSKINT